MTPQQAHALKLKMALLAEASAMIEFHKGKGQSALEVVLAERDRTRNEVFAMLDELTTEA